jgi:hypothetical protein
MFHIDQSLCMLWHDWIGPTTPRLGAKSTNFYDELIKPMVINTHSEGSSTNWRLGMSNAPLVEVFIDVFTKCYKFVLWQIVDGSEWRLCSFHKINGAVIWSMFGQGFHISFLKHIFEFLVLRRNFMWSWFNIWWKKNVNKKCISFHSNFHESFCSNK